MPVSTLSRAQRSVRTETRPAQKPLPRGGTEPAPYRSTENTLKTAPPVPPRDGFQRKGPQALPLVVLRRVWEGNRNPSQNFSWGARGGILSIRKEYPLASPRSSSELSPPPNGRDNPGPPTGATCRRASPAPRLPTGPRRRGVVTPPYEAPGKPARPQRGPKAAGLPRHPRPAQRAGPRSLSLIPRTAPPAAAVAPGSARTPEAPPPRPPGGSPPPSPPPG